jgi:hypothetical protein
MATKRERLTLADLKDLPLGTDVRGRLPEPVQKEPIAKRPVLSLNVPPPKPTTTKPVERDSFGDPVGYPQSDPNYGKPKESAKPRSVQQLAPIQQDTPLRQLETIVGRDEDMDEDREFELLSVSEKTMKLAVPGLPITFSAYRDNPTQPFKGVLGAHTIVVNLQTPGHRKN